MSHMEKQKMTNIASLAGYQISAAHGRGVTSIKDPLWYPHTPSSAVLSYYNGGNNNGLTNVHMDSRHRPTIDRSHTSIARQGTVRRRTKRQKVIPFLAYITGGVARHTTSFSDTCFYILRHSTPYFSHSPKSEGGLQWQTDKPKLSDGKNL